MLKVVWGGRFKDGVATEEVRSHWTDVHGALGLKAEGLEGYVQNHVIGAISDREIHDDPVFLDGYSVQWWQDEATFIRAMGSPEWDAVRADGESIFDASGSFGTDAVVQPRVLKEGPRLPFKVVWFARFLPHINREEASDHWLNVHGEIAIESPDVGRYIQNLVVGTIGPDGSITAGEVKYDGFSECWFSDRAAYERAVSSEPWARLEQDAATLFDMDAMSDGMSAVLDERVIRDHERHESG
jgi:hypothetical protein